jgi:calcineurin-like phosphoesterase family protein
MKEKLLSNFRNDIWFISDTHFQHNKILEYSSSRKAAFNNTKQMDEILIENWNSLIKPEDKVYHLGDVTFGSRKSYAEDIHPRLNGKKRLIVGNHDDIRFFETHRLFQKIMLWRVFKDPAYPFIFSHVPVFRREIVERTGQENGINVHGHLHDEASPTTDHFCVCVEHTNFRPMHIEEIKQRTNV